MDRQPLVAAAPVVDLRRSSPSGRDGRGWHVSIVANHDRPWPVRKRLMLLHLRGAWDPRKHLDRLWWRPV